MRTLMVCEPGIDGVFRHCEMLVAHLLRRNTEVHFAYSSRRSSDALLVMVDRIRRSGGRVLDLRVGPASEAGDFLALARLFRFMAQTKPDIVHAHSFKAGMLARTLRFLGVKVPILYTPHAYFAMGQRSGPAAFVSLQIERVLARRAITIHVSDSEKEWARSFLNLADNRQLLIPNGVDHEHFSPPSTPNRARARKSLGIPEDAFAVGTVARFTFQKDPVTLYRGFGKFAESTPSAFLVHIGTGELQGRVFGMMGAALEGRIKHIPSISDTSLFYSALDLYVSSSRYEGLSYSVLEALATGLPLVLSNVAGNQDFLRIGLNQVWPFSAGDADGLAEALFQAEQASRNGDQSNHRSKAIALFNSEKAVSEILACYGQLAGRDRHTTNWVES